MSRWFGSTPICRSSLPSPQLGTFSPDGKELTFKLDPNAKFQNGAAVTSADVKASFERILDEKTAAVNRANFLSVASIETPDAGTVIFNLSQPDVPILIAMTDTNSSILPASEIAAGTIGTTAIGSGPFKLDKWDPNSKEVLSANKDWAGGNWCRRHRDHAYFPTSRQFLRQCAPARSISLC